MNETKALTATTVGDLPANMAPNTIASSTVALLAEASEEAVQTLRAMMNDADVSPSARVAAARAIVEVAFSGVAVGPPLEEPTAASSWEDKRRIGEGIWSSLSKAQQEAVWAFFRNDGGCSMCGSSWEDLAAQC